jgi:DNA processing protein
MPVEDVRGACAQCLRRGWVLAELSALLDRNCRADERLLELLALEDLRLIAAIGGRRREELARAYERLPAQGAPRGPAPIGAICPHDARYPNALRDRAAPRLLFISGGIERLCSLAREPCVALVGTAHPSAYGIETARRLARELAASGVTIVAQRNPGIALAALEGALQAEGAAIAVAGDGLAVPVAKARRDTCKRIDARGCTLSELPDHARGRSWGGVAAVRVLAALCGVAVIVEAEDNPPQLRGARLAWERGRTVAAVPGPADSPASAGCHALLREGATLVRDAADVLDLLYGVERDRWAKPPPSEALPSLTPALRELFQRVGTGSGTLAELAGGRDDASAVLHALSELELLGLVTRDGGGAYVIKDGQARSASTSLCPRQMES